MTNSLNQDYFDDTHRTEWEEKHPGNKTFICSFCGVYKASKAQCNKCEEEIELNRNVTTKEENNNVIN